MWLLLALLPTANAQSQARLIDGSPEFGCQQPSSCPVFYGFLSNAMAEQAFTLQHVPQLTSPVLFDGTGVVAGGMLDTFPFAKPRENLAGKEENTSFSPVLPRIVLGWLGPGPGGARIGAGVAFTPPIPVKGASILLLGLDVASSWDLEPLRLGVEADFTWGRARAPIAATEEQFENRDSFDNPNNLDPDTYNAVCKPQPHGCIDTFSLANIGVRFAVAWEVTDRVAPYARLGVAWVDERLWINYDGTTWGVRGLQPSLHAGVALEPVERFELAGGAILAYRSPKLAQSGKAGLFFELQGSAAWRFGKKKDG